ncbi:hypothetical protein FRX31_028146 [Thalictrum thalictroides]|uniref:Uncharacterized protein n=1 Tax=Thalictrum thalictroides TaxID=46969 RepID=A0A7J6VCC4_THATH|nr:hypothetical protein FRX31_028146 [Thalictrum thalictroides]
MSLVYKAILAYSSFLLLAKLLICRHSGMGGSISRPTSDQDLGEVFDRLYSGARNSISGYCPSQTDDRINTLPGS